MAELKIFTAEELKKMTPAERIKRLRELEEARKKELEDAKKSLEQELEKKGKELKDREREVQEQIAQTEALIQESREEAEKEEVDEAIRELQRRRTEPEEEGLEARVEEARVQEPEIGQYRTGNLYDMLDRAAERLDELGNKKQWDEYDVQSYRRVKADIERAQTYSLESDNLRSELGLAVDGLHKLLYRK